MQYYYDSREHTKYLKSSGVEIQMVQILKVIWILDNMTFKYQPQDLVYGVLVHFWFSLRAISQK